MVNYRLSDIALMTQSEIFTIYYCEYLLVLTRLNSFFFYEFNFLRYCSLLYI